MAELPSDPLCSAAGPSPPLLARAPCQMLSESTVLQGQWAGQQSVVLALVTFTWVVPFPFVCSMCHRISVSLKLYYLQCQCKMSVTHNSQTLRAHCDRRTCNRGQHPLKINVYTDYQK